MVSKIGWLLFPSVLTLPLGSPARVAEDADITVALGASEAFGGAMTTNSSDARRAYRR